MVLGGFLIGIGSQEEQGLELGWAGVLRKRLEGALVKATNLALVEVREMGEMDATGGWSIALVFNHAFGCLGDVERAGLDYDVSALFSNVTDSMVLMLLSFSYLYLSGRHFSRVRDSNQLIFWGQWIWMLWR
jgi:hypothetical protein